MAVKKKLEPLEALRGFAAAYVFVHHAQVSGRSGLGSLFYFGQEAVILFFLLSGFVIFYATLGARGEVSAGRYLLLRARRIFPLLLIALAAAYVSASMVAGALADPMWGNLLQNVLMLQDVSFLKRGVWVDTYHGNTPLWSLSYEWWFYLLFIPVELLRRGRGRFVSSLAIATTVSILGFIGYQWHPNQPCLFAGYFVIWWAGVEAAREYLEHSDVTFARQRNALLSLGTCAALWSMPAVLALVHGEGFRFGFDPFLQARHFAAAFAIVIAGLSWRRVGLRGFRWIFGPFRLLAPISYSLYLLHVPVLDALQAVGFQHPLARAACAALLLLPVCYLLEVRLQRVINGWTDPPLQPRGWSNDGGGVENQTGLSAPMWKQSSSRMPNFPGR